VVSWKTAELHLFFFHYALLSFWLGYSKATQLNYLKRLKFKQGIVKMFVLLCTQEVLMLQVAFTLGADFFHYKQSNLESKILNYYYCYYFYHHDHFHHHNLHQGDVCSLCKSCGFVSVVTEKCWKNWSTSQTLVLLSTSQAASWSSITPSNPAMCLLSFRQS